MKFFHTSHIHFGISRGKNWFIISSAWHAKWQWSNSGSYWDKSTRQKSSRVYNALQVSVLQRIGSILKSEWKSSIFLHIKSLKHLWRMEMKGRKKKRKRKCVQFTARTHARMGTCYWSMGSWGHHQWVMDQHGMAGLSLRTYSNKSIHEQVSECVCALSYIVSSSTRKIYRNNNQHNQESGIVTITNYIILWSTLVCATMWIKYLQIKWKETKTKRTVQHGAAQHKAKHFNGI